MTEKTCDELRDHLPDLLLGALDPGTKGEVEAHLSACPECREELELLEAVRRARPEPPVGLEASIQARVQAEFGTNDQKVAGSIQPGRTRRRGGLNLPLFGGRILIPTSAFPAAAVVILSLGVALVWNQMITPGTDVEQEPIQVVLAEEPLPEAYLWDDGIVAGAPVFDGLTEEDLLVLLEEMEEEA
jgi:anti-sigma factor RsiW